MENPLQAIPWAAELPASIMVIDAGGVVLAMNDTAANVTYASEGGMSLIGSNCLDCHPPAARDLLEDLLRTRRAYSYTTEKNGVKKFIRHSPWYQNGAYAGIVELIFELPADMPHFVRC